jgi:hypothetical protein
MKVLGKRLAGFRSSIVARPDRVSKCGQVAGCATGVVDVQYHATGGIRPTRTGNVRAHVR